MEGAAVAGGGGDAFGIEGLDEGFAGEAVEGVGIVTADVKVPGVAGDPVVLAAGLDAFEVVEQVVEVGGVGGAALGLFLKTLKLSVEQDGLVGGHAVAGGGDRVVPGGA